MAVLRQTEEARCFFKKNMHAQDSSFLFQSVQFKRQKTYSFASVQFHNCQKQMWKEDTKQLSFYMPLSKSLSNAHLEEMECFVQERRGCALKMCMPCFQKEQSKPNVIEITCFSQLYY